MLRNNLKAPLNRKEARQANRLRQVNLLVDLVYAAIDPRVRYAWHGAGGAAHRAVRGEVVEPRG